MPIKSINTSELQKSYFWANISHPTLRKGRERDQSIEWVGEKMHIGKRVFLPLCISLPSSFTLGWGEPGPRSLVESERHKGEGSFCHSHSRKGISYGNFYRDWVMSIITQEFAIIFNLNYAVSTQMRKTFAASKNPSFAS